MEFTPSQECEMRGQLDDVADNGRRDEWGNNLDLSRLAAPTWKSSNDAPASWQSADATASSDGQARAR
jgi:hypothetical protein